MRTNTIFTLLLSAFVMTGCVDSDYDLSKATSGDITIGDENTVLEIPIVTITLTTQDLDGTRTKTDVEHLTLDEILTLANAFMPSGESIDIATLIDETTTDTGTVSSDYIKELTYKLITELQTSQSKREDLAKELLANEDLIDENVYDTFGIVDLEGYSSYIDLANAISTAVNVTDAEIDTIAEDVVNYISGDILDALKEYAVIDNNTEIENKIEIPADIEKLFENNDLTPVVKCSTNMPFKISLDELKLQGGGKNIDFMSNDAFNISDIKDLLDSGNIVIDYKASLNEYSANGIDLENGTFTVATSLKVKGSIFVD